MIAILHVSESMSRARQQFDARAAADPYPPQAVDLIRRDLANASMIQPGKGSFSMLTYNAIDLESGISLNQPVEVRYGIEQLGKRSWLVRIQKSMLSHGRGDEWTECVLGDIDVMNLVPQGPAATGPYELVMGQQSTNPARVDELLTIR